MTEATPDTRPQAPSLRHHLREHWLVALLLGILLAAAVGSWQYQRFLPQFNQQIEANLCAFFWYLTLHNEVCSSLCSSLHGIGQIDVQLWQ